MILLMKYHVFTLESNSQDYEKNRHVRDIHRKHAIQDFNPRLLR